MRDVLGIRKRLPHRLTPKASAVAAPTKEGSEANDLEHCCDKSSTSNAV